MSSMLIHGQPSNGNSGNYLALASITLASTAKTLALDEARGHAGCNHTFENMAQDLALPEAAEPVHRARRMVRNPVVKIELAEPAISKVQRHFLAQPARIS